MINFIDFEQYSCLYTQHSTNKLRAFFKKYYSYKYHPVFYTYCLRLYIIYSGCSARYAGPGYNAFCLKSDIHWLPSNMAICPEGFFDVGWITTTSPAWSSASGRGRARTTVPFTTCTGACTEAATPACDGHAFSTCTCASGASPVGNALPGAGRLPVRPAKRRLTPPCDLPPATAAAWLHARPGLSTRLTGASTQ